jgi:hypothetical protein
MAQSDAVHFGLGERLFAHRDRQRGGLHDPQRRAGQGVDPLGMQIGPVHPVLRNRSESQLDPAEQK